MSFWRFGLLSRIYALVLLTFAAVLIASLAFVTIGLRRHPNQHNLIGFVTAVLCDFLGLYILVRLWSALVVPRVQPPSEPTP
jgi:hypothetical protein